MKRKKNNTNLYLIVAIIIVIGIGAFLTFKDKLAPTETPKGDLREIELSVLGTDCKECFNVTSAIDALKKIPDSNLKVKELTIDESKELTEKYNITKLPAFILSGNITNLTINGFEDINGTLVSNIILPPYYDLTTKEIKGNVEVMILADKDCTECFNMSLILDQLKLAGVTITQKDTIDYKTEEGQKLVNEYKIDKIPTAIFNEEALEYDIINQVWNEVGTKEGDKLVLRYINPPYKNLTTGKTEGLVTFTYVIDEKCEECYDPVLFEELMKETFNMYINKTETYDSESTKGKYFIKKYNITQIPTLIMSKEAQTYPAMNEGWPQIGTIEKDGALIFRQMEILKQYHEQQGQKFAYKDLTTGEIVKTETNETVETESNETV